ncbi:hypothetical protein [Zavarzinella formosa]|uniref:hypothetical protein n=1 Tax=Zavarzinella formosa TaxID=360055 RepID=UPI0002E01186|nr:hypothetical protein [Zavarzinella formosa]
MPTDAKCGLLVGVGLVIAVAILFFQKDPEAPALAIPSAEAKPVAAVPKPEEKPLPPPPLAPIGEAPGRFVSLTK